MLDFQHERSQSTEGNPWRYLGVTFSTLTLFRGHGVGTEWDEAQLEKLAISQQVLDKTFKDKVVGYCGGLITEAHRVWNERQKFTVGEISLNPPHFISCQKGSQRTQGYDPPNQDNWSVTAFKSGWTLFFKNKVH